MRRVVGVVASFCFSVLAYGVTEKTIDYSVQVSATVTESPARITLHWPQDSSCKPQNYFVSRKAPGDAAWGRAISLAGTVCEYTDRDVTPGIAYEYQVAKATTTYSGYGYICAGAKVPLKDQRGKLLLVVENKYAGELATELARLEQDLTGDGWQVKRFDVSRADTPASVKQKIKARYQLDPANVKAVFLFGHVPVAYSGDIVPDGHAPDHQGAWPCDGFYADMDGVWTDKLVNDISATDKRNRNVPGDGKYDQSTFPAPLKLMVGRVDLSKMPGRLSAGGEATFPDELELLRNYLNKDHNFRYKQFDLPRRGVVGDYFGVRDGEAFAASGWRNLASFFSPVNVTTIKKEGAWISNLSTNSYLWAYGCGPGSFTSIGGLGNSDSYHDGVTTELYRNDPKAAFAMLYGSWLGDWDSEDNFQRATLALPSYGLTCVWSGRPHWFLHHMALGETIGYSTRLTQNNRVNGLYRNQQNNCAGQIHIALMGDPTLRMHTVTPPASLSCVFAQNVADLYWEASPDNVIGYHVYRARGSNRPYERLTAAPVETCAFKDISAETADSYMVRAVKLESSASGTYYNASQGIFYLPGDVGRLAAAGAERPADLPHDGDQTAAAGKPAPVPPTGR